MNTDSPAKFHMLDVLVREHEIILGFLDELEALNQSVQEMDGFSPEATETTHARQIAEHLLDAEPHHQREEQVLFPELERCGISGPQEVMLNEHEILRKLKHQLRDMADNADGTSFDEFKRQLNYVSGGIITTLRDHISKENNILYEMAKQSIREAETWKRMESECDKIGYCSFTPDGLTNQASQ